MSTKTLCRLCGRNVKEYVNMFSDEGMKRKLGIKTATCLQIPVSICDGLPTILCQRCCRKLDNSYAFFERASKVQIFLENVYHPLSELRIEIDPETPKPIELEETPKSPRKDIKRDKDIPTKLRKTDLLEGYPWSCVLCTTGALDTLEDLCNHYRFVHERSAIFECMHCRNQYEKYRSFTKHLKSHQNSMKFECNDCGKIFTAKQSLIRHTLVHTDKRPFKCDICDKCFKSQSTLTIHAKIHLPSDKKPDISCETCNKQFTTRRALENHLKMHNGEMDFMCEVCGKAFVSHGTLTDHIKIHTEMKNYCCNMCDMRFRTESQLKRHGSTHSQLKPFRCEVCDKMFKNKFTMSCHMRLHTGEMPYSCDYCGKKFRFLGTMRVHTRQHTGEKPFSCAICEKTFTNGGNYDKHMKRMHKVLYEIKRLKKGKLVNDEAPGNNEQLETIVERDKVNFT